MAQGCVPGGIGLGLVRPQDDIDRYAVGQVERDRHVGLTHAAGDMRRDFHADGERPPARRDQHLSALGQPLQALQRPRSAGFGGRHQTARAVLIAQHDDAAAAQFSHGAFDGGQGGSRAGMGLAGGHGLV